MTSMCPLLDVLVADHNRARRRSRAPDPLAQALAKMPIQDLERLLAEKAGRPAQASTSLLRPYPPPASTHEGPMINVETFNDPLGFNRRR